MSFNIYNILIIAGIIQGFIFTAIVLFNKKYHSKSTFFLIALIFCYSLGNLMYILPDIGSMHLVTMYGYWYLPFAAIDAPIIYFYVVLFLFPSKKISFREKLLFVPFLLFLMFTLFFRLRLILGYDIVYPLNSYYRSLIIFIELFSALFSVFILIMCLHKTVKFNKERKLYDTAIIRPEIKWLKSTLYVILFFTVLWTYLAIRNIFYTNGETIFYSLWIGMAALIYWLGHIGIYKYGIIVERKKIRKYLQDKTLTNPNNNSPLNTSNSKCSNTYVDKLEQYIMHNKMYLNSNLTLENVAQHLQLSPSYLSRIIHNEMNTSFPEYLNFYRIEEVKRYLKNPAFSKYTIVSIGLEAGFNSRSSFYNVFKKATGKTPRAYQKEIISK